MTDVDADVPVSKQPSGSHQRQASGDVEQGGRALKLFEALTNFIKAAAWPLIAIAVFLEFRQPIREAVAVIPKKMSESQKLTVGSLSIEIEKRANAVGDPELATLIDGLSPQAIELMLRLKREGTSVASSSGGDEPSIYYFPKAEEYLTLKELDLKHLIDPGVDLTEYRKFVETKLRLMGDSGNRDNYQPRRPLTPEEKHEIWKAQYRLSERGAKAVQLIISAVSRELQKPPAATAPAS